MGDGAFQLLLSAPHRRATPASAAAARTEDGVQRRDIDRKDPRGPGGLAVLWRRPSQSVGPVAHGGGSDLEGPRASVDARSAATGPHSSDPGAENPHTGTIITEQPNEVWGTDNTATLTLEDGQVTVFVAVDHCTTECVGLHAAKRATRFEALEPIRQGVRDYCGGFRAEAAAGLLLPHDHGSQDLSDDF